MLKQGFGAAIVAVSLSASSFSPKAQASDSNFFLKRAAQLQPGRELMIVKNEVDSMPYATKSAKQDRQVQDMPEYWEGVGGTVFSYIGDATWRKLRIKNDANDPWAFSVLMNPQGSYYDSGSNYREVVGKPQTVAIEFNADGNSFVIAGKTWTKKSGSFESGSMTITDGNQDVVLQHGKRLNLAASDDPKLKNLYVNFGAVDIEDAFHNGAFNPNNKKIYIYTDDFSSAMGGEARMKAGDSYTFPVFGGKIKYDGLTSSDQLYTQMNLTCQSGRSLSVGMDNDPNQKQYTVTGNFMRLTAITDAIMINNTRVDDIYVVVNRNDNVIDINNQHLAEGTVLYKASGYDYFLKASVSDVSFLDFGPGSGGLLLQPGASGTFGITETARPEGAPWNAPPVSLLFPYTSAPDGYRFKRSDSDVSVVHYQGIRNGSAGSYETPFVDERGSQVTGVGPQSALIEYSNVIAKAQYSIDVSGTTSVHDIGALKPGQMNLLKVNPNVVRTGTSFKFTLEQEAHVSIKLYNIMGGEVANITDARHAAGPHEIGANLSNLPSGIYMAQLTVGNERKDMQRVVVQH